MSQEDELVGGEEVAQNNKPEGQRRVELRRTFSKLAKSEVAAEVLSREFTERSMAHDVR